MKILTVQQPWAHLIVHGRKNIENRNVSTRYRGPVLILASKTVREGEDYVAWVLGAVPEEPLSGGIVGICNVVDIVEDSDSKWFGGPYGWVLENRRPLPFTPWPGSLALIDAPAKLVRRLKL